ncbi:hypothetical protein D9M73_227710 [compost metagenome]
MTGPRLQALKASEVGQWIRFRPRQLFSHQHMLETLAQAHGIEHMHGVGPGRIGHHGHADACLFGMLEQADQSGGGLQRR